MSHAVSVPQKNQQPIRKLKRTENLSVIPFKIFNLIEIKFMPNLILFYDSLAFK